MDMKMKNDLILYCEYTKTPIGVENLTPRFGWRGVGALRESLQKSYRIRVWKDEDLVWDSGEVLSDQSSAVCYGGAALQAATRYRWSVTVTTLTDCAYTGESWFETGLFREEDWHGARWIGHPNPQRGVAPLLRRVFSLTEKPRSARLYLSGIGYAVTTVNGVKTDSSLLDPGWTDYQKTVLYRAWDVTDLLHAGENVLGVELGEGWYGNNHPNFLNLIGSMPSWLGTPKMICALQADDQWLVSDADGQWLASDGPVRKNNVFDGEWYDARLEKQGWQLPGYSPDPAQWEPALGCEGPGGKLRCQMIPAIGKKREIKPVYITYPDLGGPYEVVADLGVNIAGWASVTFTGKVGQKVELRYAEVLDHHSGVNQDNLRGAKATDTFILGKDGKNTYEPHFTYHGFRYVQVKTDPGVIVTKIRGWQVHTLVEQTGDFTCGNDLLNRTYRAILQTEQNNLHSVPTDCPQRDERLGWVNDMTARCEEGLYNFDMMVFYEKWLQDLSDSQDPQTGSIPDTAPYFFGGSPAFHISSAYVLIPWLLYCFYGDKRPMEQHYKGMKRYVEFKLGQRDDNGLIFNHYFGDWSAPMTESLLGWGENAVPMNNPQQLVTTCYLQFDCQLMEKMAVLLDKQDDAAYYRKLQAIVRDDINRAFFHEEGYYAQNAQGSNAFPLFLNLVPDGKREIVLQNLLEDLFVERGGRLSTGNQLTKYLYEVLGRESCHQQAFRLATYSEYPSIGFMLSHGATTIWERWEKMAGNHMNSHNHPMLGAFTIWFQKGLCGLDPQCRTEDGRLLLRPHTVDGLQKASAKLGTPQGSLALAWEKTDHGVCVQVEVPWNTTVDLQMPSSNGRRICTIGPGVHIFEE